MSEFELSLLRQRSEEAIRQKARRGELQFLLPVGFCWTTSGKIEKDPDERVQQAIELVFRKITDLGSVRRVLLWFAEEKVCLPAFPRDPGERKMIWKLPVYSNIRAILTIPIYAGAYAFGKTETRTHIVNGRARKTVGHPKPRCEWTVLISRPSPRLHFMIFRRSPPRQLRPCCDRIEVRTPARVCLSRSSSREVLNDGRPPSELPRPSRYSSRLRRR
jgi:hypothetical protein